MNQEFDPSSAARHRIVVIGASAGGVETLRRVVAGLPADLPAAICIVLHLAPNSPSALASILRRVTSLPCRTAVDGELLRDGEILVAPPDRHLAIEDGRVSLTVGPRENGHRPSIDVLFRSAAAAKDGQVIGVVLSGTRDDGTAGLAVIKSQGGSAIVQDPEEALYAGMPASAIAHVTVDRVVPSAQVAEAIVSMVNGNNSDTADPPAARPQSDRPMGPVTTACPDCGGVMSEDHEAGVTQWRCKVGHRYSPESLADAQARAVETALWAAVRALDDRNELLDRMGAEMEGRGLMQAAREFQRRAREAAIQSRAVREALADAADTTLRPLDLAAAEADAGSAE
ncbi:MAG: chemotaxis protein CheB [Solirubrobacteraceae bacterium]